MTTFEVLQEFENFYDAIKPAQESCEEAFVWLSGIPHLFFNAVMHLKIKENLNAKIETLISQAPKNIPISYWVHNQNGSNNLAEVLKKKGFQPMITCQLMTSTVKAVASPNFQIEPANLEIFHHILSTAFHFDEEVKEGFSKLVKNAEAENYLVYFDGQPVGTGTLIPNGKKTGGIFNIATLHEYQKNGCAQAMMKFLINRASILGLEKLILLSSPSGKKLYSKLGFISRLEIEIYAKNLPILLPM